MSRRANRIRLGRAGAWLLAAAVAGCGEPTPTTNYIFSEVASVYGLRFSHFNGMSGEIYFPEMVGGGVALFDYDNDGDLDVFLGQGTMLGAGKTLADALFPPAGNAFFDDRLYRNDLVVQADGSRTQRFTDVTAASGLNSNGYNMGVTVGDYNNDGYVDLYVTNFGPNKLFRNNGNGSFTDVTAAAGVDDRRWSVSAAFVDVDGDGFLDLYVGNYVDFTFANQRQCRGQDKQLDYCGPLVYSPEPDRLFRNRGDGSFEDITASSGLGAEYGAALGIATADYNGDGRMDLYVANDGSANQMWINQGGNRFLDDALIAGVAVNMEGVPEASMGVDVADFDGDGDEDIFVSHLRQESNTLYLNDGKGWFEDATAATGLGVASYPYTGFGTRWIDYDNDGWLDVFIANGAVKRIEELANRGDPYPLHQVNQLFRNVAGRFSPVKDFSAPLSAVSRGAAFGDIDNDGDTDIVVANNNGPVHLLRNDVGQDNHWLGLRLASQGYAGAAPGARVEVRCCTGRVLWRRVRVDSSYAAASDPRLIVGLGSATRIDQLIVHWPGGNSEEFFPSGIDRYHTLTEGQGRSL